MDNMLLELFYWNDRDYTDEELNAMWNHNINRFIQTLFYLRCPRSIGDMSGRGLKKIYFRIILWMSKNKTAVLTLLLPYMVSFGCWKDLLQLFNTPLEAAVLELFTSQLQKDYKNYNRTPRRMISLVSKWVPNENSALDLRYAVFKKIAKRLGISRKSLRKDYLVPLRKELGIIEHHISTKSWSEVNYSLLTAVNRKKYHRQFMLHDGARYFAYLNENYKYYWQELNLPTIVKNYLNDIPNHLNIYNERNNNDTMIAIDIKGSCKNIPTIIGAYLAGQLGLKSWLSFDRRSNNDLIECNTIKDKSNNCYIDEIILANKNGYNVENCIKWTIEQNYGHLIIITNEKIHDIDNNNALHLTVWNINYEKFSLICKKGITYIEGYNYCVCEMLAQDNIIEKNLLADNILSYFPDISN